MMKSTFLRTFLAGLIVASLAPAQAPITQGSPEYDKLCGALSLNEAWRNDRKAKAADPNTSAAEKKRLNKLVKRAEMRVTRVKNMKDRCPPATGTPENPPILFGKPGYTEGEKKKRGGGNLLACCSPEAVDRDNPAQAGDKCTEFKEENQDKEKVIIDEKVLNGDANKLALVIGHEGSRLSQVLTTYTSTQDKVKANDKDKDKEWDDGLTPGQYKEQMNKYAINAEIRATDADFLDYIIETQGLTTDRKTEYNNTVNAAGTDKLMMNYCATKSSCPAPKLPVDMPDFIY